MPFYHNDVNKTESTIHAIRVAASELHENRWVSLLNRDNPRFRVVEPSSHMWWLEHSWVDLYSNEEDDVVEYLIIDTIRRAIEIVRIMSTDPDLSIARITSSLNRIDHEDERYLCDWHEGRRSRDFTRYISDMIDDFMEFAPCGREEAVARFRSLVIQCFSDIEGSHYRRGREFRRDGIRLASRWWSAFLPQTHALYRDVAPSSDLRRIEEQEFSAIPREDLYEDVESYRAGRRAIAIARSLMPRSIDDESGETPREEIIEIEDDSRDEETPTTTPAPLISAETSTSSPATPTRAATTASTDNALAWDESVETGKRYVCYFCK